jgi:hypothetical protein
MKILLASFVLICSTWNIWADDYSDALDRQRRAIEWLDTDIRHEAWQARQDYEDDRYWRWIYDQQERRAGQRIDRPWWAE